MQLLTLLGLGAVAVSAAAAGNAKRGYPSYQYATLKGDAAVKSYCTKNYPPRPTTIYTTVTETSTKLQGPTTLHTTITGGQAGTVTVTDTATSTTTTTPTTTVCGTAAPVPRSPREVEEEKRSYPQCPAPPRAMKGYDCNHVRDACSYICPPPRKTITRTRCTTVTVTPTVTATDYVTATTTTTTTTTTTATAPTATSTTFPDFQTDGNNCGSCGNVCPSGTSCTTGTCRFPNGCPTRLFNCDTDAGQGANFQCGAPGANCICFESVNGGPACVQDFSCPTSTCQTDADCLPTEACTQDTTCCRSRTCASTAGCPNLSSPTRMFRRALGDKARRDAAVTWASGKVAGGDGRSK